MKSVSQYRFPSFSPGALLLTLLVVLGAQLAQGQRVNTDGLNNSVEIYRNYYQEYGFPAGVFFNPGLAGSERHPRLTFVQNQVPLVDGLKVDSYLGFDAPFPSLKGTVAAAVEHRGHMNESSVQVHYALDTTHFKRSNGKRPRVFSTSMGLQVTRRPFAQRSLLFTYLSGGIIESGAYQLGLYLRYTWRYEAAYQVNMSRSYRLSDRWRGNVTGHLGWQFEEFEPYHNKGERWAIYNSDTLHQANRVRLMLVNSFYHNHLIVSGGASVDYNTMSFDEERDQTKEFFRFRPVVQVGWRTKQLGLLVGMRGFTVSWVMGR